MHILVDIRTQGPSTLVRFDYGIAWARLWRDYHPNDTITFLATEGAIIEGELVIHVSKQPSVFSQKKIAHHKHGPDRIISFSDLESIDRSIPTITHIFDSASLLYPRGDMGIIERKLLERQYQHLLRDSHHLIVPHLEIGMELVEIFSIPEKKISVIPYFIPERHHSPFSRLYPYNITLGYWIVEGTAWDEWNPFGLLHAYSHYIHEHLGTKRLIIAGDLGVNLKHITECIRGLSIMDYVKIIGILPAWDRACLYEYASGWIAVWGYYSAGPNLALALSYGLPILASDIAPLRDAGDLLIHPNHTDELTENLMLLSKLFMGNEKYIESSHVVADVYGRVIAECACK